MLNYQRIYVIVFMVGVDALTNYQCGSNLVFYWEKKMKFNYNKLWKMLIDRNMMKKDLMEKTGITGTTIAKMGRGEAVNLSVIGRICKELQVNVGDIVDYEE